MHRHAIVAVTLLALSPAAGAEDACSAEVSRLCPRGRGDLLVLGCLRSHEAELQVACKGDLDLLLAKARDIGTDCEGDVQKLCKDVQPGEGRVATCLKDQESFLSTGCQSAFNEWRLLRMELSAACSGDVGRWCKDVPPGSGRIWRCLREHTSHLTSDCRSAVQKL